MGGTPGFLAIVLLLGVAFSMARHTGTNLLKLIIPLFAGVAAAAAFLLPGPAPMLLASHMYADFGWMILLPLVLVGLKTIAARFVAEGSTIYEWFEFIDHPFTAILVACLVAIYGLAMRQGMPKDKVMEICSLPGLSCW